MLAYVKGTVELYLRALAREVGPLCSSGSWNLIFIEMDFNGMEMIMMALDFYSRYHSIVKCKFTIRHIFYFEWILQLCHNYFCPMSCFVLLFLTELP